MATVVARPRLALSAERRFFLTTAIALLALSMVGFGPSYYLMRFTGAPALPPIVHLHGMVCTGWMLLLVAQAGLISARRLDLHRLAGSGGVLLAAVIVATGLQIAVSRSRPPRDFTPEAFLIFPFTAMALFAFFVALGAIQRRDPAAHKRLMLLGTMSLVVPAGARVARMLQSNVVVPGPIGGMLIADLFLIALAVFDWRTRGRLHPVTLWGGGLFLVSQPLRVAVAQSEAWQNLARLLIA
jgi:hypothetical protein